MNKTSHRFISDNHEIYKLNGNLHRVDGPAYIAGGFKSWWRYGKRHRSDGPAIENITDGRYEWYLEGEKVFVQSQEEFERYMRLKCFW